MESIKSTVFKVVSIAHDFYRVDKSEVTLLKESGYFENYEKITEDLIMEELKLHPDLIQDWLRLSDDNRSTNRWVYKKGDSGKYHLGHWPELDNFKDISSFDKFFICALYIKHDIEDTRLMFQDN